MSEWDRQKKPKVRHHQWVKGCVKKFFNRTIHALSVMVDVWSNANDFRMSNMCFSLIFKTYNTKQRFDSNFGNIQLSIREKIHFAQRSLRFSPFCFYKTTIDETIFVEIKFLRRNWSVIFFCQIAELRSEQSHWVCLLVATEIISDRMTIARWNISLILSDSSVLFLTNDKKQLKKGFFFLFFSLRFILRCEKRLVMSDDENYKFSSLTFSSSFTFETTDRLEKKKINYSTTKLCLDFDRYDEIVRIKFFLRHFLSVFQVIYFK